MPRQEENMPEYKVVDSRVLFDHPMARILLDTLECDGKQRAYFYLTSPVDSVATVGVTANEEIILTRQYRHPVREVIYDLPAGRLEPGEDALQGARREFEEETGYYPAFIKQIGRYNQFPGTLRAATNLFFARELIPTQQNLDEGEELEITFKPVWQVLEMIFNGEIIDGSLQLGVLLALQKGLIHALPM
jgi:ADP-ribose pyrophosphatase